MFDRPWVRLVVGALAALLLGAMAARVAVSAGAGAGDGGALAAKGSGPGGGSGYGGGGGGSSGSGSAGGSSGERSSSGGATATLSGGSGTVTVHVTGEVRRPGVYTLKEGSRVDDAVKRAGGPTHDGDRQALNLAAPVRDGQQVRVPLTVAAARAAAGAGAGSVAGGAASGGEDAAAGGPGGAAAPVDLNTATLEELQTLDGVGPTTAEKIIKLREERGGLAGVDDLDEVPGIGAKKLEALRAQLEP